MIPGFPRLQAWGGCQYLDEHLPQILAIQLRTRGIDVITTAEAGNANQRLPDESQLTFATREHRILVTEDRDFTRLAQQSTEHAGIVFFPVKLSLGAYIDYLELLALTTDPADIAGQLVFGRW